MSLAPGVRLGAYEIMSLIVVAVFVLCAPAIVALQTPQAPAATPPNVILIMSDDMGYGDLSSYGARDIKTPNIDSISRDGIRLTDVYANGVL
jgi:Sulfatase